MKSHRLMLLAASALAAACTVSAEASAQTFPEVTQQMRNSSHRGHPAFGGLNEYRILARNWSVNTFYIVWTGAAPERRPHWVIRRAIGDGDGQTGLVWADSRDCPAVAEVLTDMEGLPGARWDVPGLGDSSDQIGLVLDGVAYTVWNRFARTGPDDASVDAELTGNVNSPAARWWTNGAAKLAGCWKPEEPR